MHRDVEIRYRRLVFTFDPLSLPVTVAVDCHTKPISDTTGWTLPSRIIFDNLTSCINIHLFVFIYMCVYYLGIFQKDPIVDKGGIPRTSTWSRKGISYIEIIHQDWVYSVLDPIHMYTFYIHTHMYSSHVHKHKKNWDNFIKIIDKIAQKMQKIFNLNRKRIQPLKRILN